MPSYAPYCLGFDLGGSRLKTVAAEETGKILLQRVSDLPPEEGVAPPSWASLALDTARSAAEELGAGALGIGVAAPGLVAEDEKSIAFMPGRLRGLEGFDWTDFLGASHKVPVLNDAQAALLGEVWVGAAVGVENAILLTLGTGVGGAAICDGKILRGRIGRAGHLGHLCLNPSGPPDVTGIPGSLEDAIGECTLRERARNRYFSTREVVEAFQKGDPEAAQIWLKSIRLLACGIASLINILDPETVLLGGGIAQAGESLFVPLAREMERVEWRPGGHTVQIKPAVLGEFAGALGAARRAWLEV
jgi:glucokinase